MNSKLAFIYLMGSVLLIGCGNEEPEAVESSEPEEVIEVVEEPEVEEEEIEKKEEVKKVKPKEQKREVVEEPEEEREVRKYNFDRSNTYEDYYPILPVFNLNENFLGGTYTVHGIITSVTETGDGYIFYLKDGEDTLKGSWPSNNNYYFDYREGDEVLVTGTLLEDNGGLYLETYDISLTSQTPYSSWRELEESMRDFYTGDEFSLAGTITEKTVQPNGTIDLLMEDTDLNEYEINIYDILNPVPNHYHEGDQIIVHSTYSEPDGETMNLPVDSLSDIQSFYEDIDTKVIVEDIDNMVEDDWGNYFITEGLITDLNIYSDHTAYFTIEQEEGILNGTLLKTSDENTKYQMLTESLAERLEVAEKEEIPVKLFGMFNKFDDEMEFIILDVFQSEAEESVEE